MVGPASVMGSSAFAATGVDANAGVASLRESRGVRVVSRRTLFAGTLTPSPSPEETSGPAASCAAVSGGADKGGELGRGGTDVVSANAGRRASGGVPASAATTGTGESTRAEGGSTRTTSDVHNASAAPKQNNPRAAAVRRADRHRSATRGCDTVRAPRRPNNQQRARGGVSLLACRVAQGQPPRLVGLAAPKKHEPARRVHAGRLLVESDENRLAARTQRALVLR